MPEAPGELTNAPITIRINERNNIAIVACQ